MNNLYPIKMQLEYLENKGIEPEKVKQYKNALNKYKNYKKQNQIQSLYNSRELSSYYRLINLISRVLMNSDYRGIIRVLDEGGSDEVIYNKLRKLIGDNIRHKYISQMKFIYNKIKNRSVKNYLDIGCGSGKKSAELGKMFGLTKEHIVCADIPQWSQYNEKKRARYSVQYQEISKDGNIKVKNAPFDLIICIHSIHHWAFTKDNFIARLKSIRNLLSDNGILVLGEHDCISSDDFALIDVEHALYEVVLLKENYKKYVREYQARYVNVMEMGLLMEEAGFKLVGFFPYDEGKLYAQLPTRTYFSFWVKKS